MIWPDFLKWCLDTCHHPWSSSAHQMLNSTPCFPQWPWGMQIINLSGAEWSFRPGKFRMFVCCLFGRHLAIGSKLWSVCLTKLFPTYSCKISMCDLRCSKITRKAAHLGITRKECVPTGCFLGGTCSMGIEWGPKWGGCGLWGELTPVLGVASWLANTFGVIANAHNLGWSVWGFLIRPYTLPVP